MLNFFGLVVRLIVGVASVAISWLVLDNIHDRNTEIIVAAVGLSYCFTFVISRRWQYYGLNTVSLFGMTASWIASQPYDAAPRQQLNLPITRNYVIVSIIFAALVELLCAYRILTSLIGHGWDRIAQPLRPLLDIPHSRAWLDLL